MKSAMIVTLAILTFCVSAIAQSQTSFKITGYRNGEYAMEPAIQQQFETIAKAVSRTHVPNNELAIDVSGYASKNGDGSKNDDLAQMRAQQIVNAFLEKFPGATVRPHSMGYDTNVRMVVISLKIVPATVHAQPIVHESKAWIWILLGMAIIILSIAGSQSRNQNKMLPSHATVELPTVPASRGPEIVEAMRPDGNKISVPLEIRDGKHVLPFLTQKEPRQLLTRDSHRDAIKAIKSCVANVYYQPEIDKLIAEGKIEEITS